MEPLDLGTEFRINLIALYKNEAPYTVDQFVVALEATTTLTGLRVEFGSSFDPTAQNSRDTVAPLCRCLANLRTRNERHPLKKLELGRAWRSKNRDSENGIHLDVFEKFLVAAKCFGISQLVFHELFFPLPIQFLLEFCRDNSLLRVLEINTVRISGSTAAVAWPPNDRSKGSAHNFHLDKLILYRIRFLSTASAASFGYFFAHLSVSNVVLGCLMAGEQTDKACRMIVSEFKVPSVEKLTLRSCCKHAKAALEAARSTVTHLTVETPVMAKNRDIPSRSEEMKYLTRLIQGTAKLQSLNVTRHYYMQMREPGWTVKALERCATITQFAPIYFHFHYAANQQLNPEIRRILTRNNDLARFVANPSTYPADKLPSLIIQFHQCPSGRFMLARCLPELLSLQSREY